MPNLSTLIDEGTRIRQTLPAKALEIFRKALEESVNKSDEEYKAISLFNIAITYLILGNYNRSISYFQDALSTDHAQINTELRSEILRGIAGNNARKYNYKEALRYFYLSENLSIQTWNMENLHMVYQGLASLYTKLNLHEKALSYTLRSLDIAVQSGFDDLLQTSLMSIGACYYKLGKYPEARKYFDESLEIKSNAFAEANALHFISNMEFDNGNFDEAEKLSRRQIDISCKENYYDFEALGLRLLGNISFKKEIYDEALSYYNNAIIVLNNVGDRTVKYAITKNIIDTYEKLDDKENMTRLYSDLYKDHVNHLQNDIQVKIEQIDLEYETEMIKQEVEREKENNLKLFKALDNVNTLNFELKELHEEKNNLMDILAHDLRNPLQNILSSVNLMNSKEDDKTFRIEMSKNITLQAKRMSSLIKRLLDYRLIEDRKIILNITEFSPSGIINNLVKNIRLLAVKKDINVISECSCFGASLRSDHELLYQILENLMTNAVKFSPHGSNIYLRCLNIEDKHIFEVEDEGPGFTAEDKTKIYSNFVKLSAQPTGDEHTTGLGLSIVKKLCDLLGADIKLESKENEGAKFTISVIRTSDLIILT